MSKVLHFIRDENKWTYNEKLLNILYRAEYITESIRKSTVKRNEPEIIRNYVA